MKKRSVVQEPRVVVIGDIMLDRYWFGNVTRISPEAPTPVLSYQNEVSSLGGAGNVANILKVLECDVCLYSAIGNDASGETIFSLLKGNGIIPNLQIIKDHPTTTKIRLIAQNQQMARIDIEKIITAHTPVSFEKIYKHNPDIVVVSDYAKGFIGNISTLLKNLRDNKTISLVDPKGDDWSRYKNADVLTPNLREFLLATKCNNDEKSIRTAAVSEIERLNLKYILITKSEDGMSLYNHKGQVRHLPTVAKQVTDVTGAGDTVIGTIAAYIAMGHSIEVALDYANTAASIVVSKVGAAHVTRTELEKNYRNKGSKVIYDARELDALLASLKRRGQKIVFTNGCFDIIHAGHVEYLQRAALEGDVLIVAINSDQSVKKLKGPQRPVNTLANRMNVISGLECVDYVVSFDEETPIPLLKKIMPNVLVKGGDYKRIEDVVGHEEVLGYKGEVKILAGQDNLSSSILLRKLQTSFNHTTKNVDP
ncbi:D-glycero-beta-D-manno-heptose 1-phosphate adenylyltransferase [Rhodobacterales bacterium FZCC0188]|nr:D-glycero-beta-D-manno-heptose 1-phosphate adenylyltransferase [Rhodobacterales bacterium FZCC0188]